MEDRHWCYFYDLLISCNKVVFRFLLFTLVQVHLTLVVRSIFTLRNNLDGPLLQEKICNLMADLKIVLIPVLLNQIRQMRPFWKVRGWGNVETTLKKNRTFVSSQTLVVQIPTIIEIARSWDKTNSEYTRDNLCKKTNDIFFLYKLSRVYSGFVLCYGHAIPIIVGLGTMRVKKCDNWRSSEILPREDGLRKQQIKEISIFHYKTET